MLARLRAAAIAAAALLLAACAGVAPRATGPSVSAEQVERFELGGRINLRVQKENFPGRVRWQHEPPVDELWFYSPLGTTVAHLRQDESGAVLVTSEGREYRARALRELAYDVLGWDLPIEAMPFWVRGLASPKAGEVDVQRDAEGRPGKLSQAGWQVSYLAWDEAGVQGLPSKLDLTGERLRMRLVIEQWQVPR